MWVFWVLVTWYMIAAASSHRSHVSRSVSYRWIALLNYYSSKWSTAVAAAAPNSMYGVNEQRFFFLQFHAECLIGTDWNVAKDESNRAPVERSLLVWCSVQWVWEYLGVWAFLSLFPWDFLSMETLGSNPYFFSFRDSNDLFHWVFCLKLQAPFSMCSPQS